MTKNLYVSFVNAQAIALPWVFGLISPTVILVGTGHPISIGHIIVGLIMLILCCLTIVEGLKGNSIQKKSDKIVLTFPPS